LSDRGYLLVEILQRRLIYLLSIWVSLVVAFDC